MTLEPSPIEEENLETTYFLPVNDNTTDGQRNFVNDLMNLAGYAVDEIIVYQNLPNNAKIFRVIFNEESESGFIFIRWDKKKKENYVANKMIDPEVYYNLKAAKEIMRQQTNKKDFGIDDIALQAPDQENLTQEEFEGLREEYNLQQEEKKLRELEKASKKKKKRKNN
ncbi:MAG: hypothetical protein ACPG8F_02035 [Flavobacteriaceae bacterium]